MNNYPYEPEQNGTDQAQNPTPPQYDYLYGEEKKQGSGFAIASLVLGILALLCCCLWYISLACGALSIAFAIIHKKRSGDMGGMALAGMVCGIVGAVIALLIFGYSLALTLTNPNWIEDFYGSDFEYALTFRWLFR